MDHVDGVQLQQADVLWIGYGLFAVGSEVKGMLEDALAGCGRWLSVESDRGTLWVFQGNELDALDWEKSSLVRTPGSTFVAVRRFVLREELLAGQAAFRLNEPRGALIVGGLVREVVVGSGLSGVAFTQVWPRSDVVKPFR